MRFPAWQRVLILVLTPIAGVLATGCGGPELMPTPNLYSHTPDNPFADVPPPLRTNTVELAYVTDRQPQGDTSSEPRYGFGRSKSLAFGLTTVRIGNNVSWDDLVAASRTAKRRVSLPLSTVATSEVGRFPPAAGANPCKGTITTVNRASSRSSTSSSSCA